MTRRELLRMCKVHYNSPEGITYSARGKRPCLECDVSACQRGQSHAEYSDWDYHSSTLVQIRGTLISKTN